MWNEAVKLKTLETQIQLQSLPCMGSWASAFVYAKDSLSGHTGEGSMLLNPCYTLICWSMGLSQARSLYFLSSVWSLRVAIKKNFENKPKGKELNKSPHEY